MPDEVLTIKEVSLVGTCGFLEVAPDECTYPDILMLMRVGERIVAELLVAAINSPYVRQQIESLAQTTNGTYKLSGEDVRALQIALPPLNEQRAIVEHIARETAKLDAVRAATERTIALLKERRAALIAAAVTGQLDVGPAA
jgi:type I restriction enzyme, S subunit